MKNLFAVLFCFTAFSFTIWHSDFEEAKRIATEKKQLILLNFSGSDWCGPCMRMKKEIFEQTAFLEMANSSLVLVNADFPRNKKNQLAKNVRQQNEMLADQYNPSGKFPFTLLLDPNGKLIKTWDGLPHENAAQYTQQLKNLCNAHKTP